MTITEITKQWQTFYAMLGGATATLMGLLFVSLALHSNSIHEGELPLQASCPAYLQQLPYAAYVVLMLLMLSLQMLVPIASRVQLVIPVASVAIVGLSWTIILRNRGLDKSDPNTSFLVRSYRMALISYLALIFLAYALISSPELALYIMLSPVLMLVISSVRNSWGLMMMIRTKDDDLM